jgi:hypothetical protein
MQAISGLWLLQVVALVEVAMTERAQAAAARAD